MLWNVFYGFTAQVSEDVYLQFLKKDARGYKEELSLSDFGFWLCK